MRLRRISYEHFIAGQVSVPQSFDAKAACKLRGVKAPPVNTPTHIKSPKCIPRLGLASRHKAVWLGHPQLASVGQTSAPNEVSELRSVFTTDARSRYGAEVISTDASYEIPFELAVDATDAGRRPESRWLLWTAPHP
jgi:hypothetical protein